MKNKIKKKKKKTPFVELTSYFIETPSDKISNNKDFKILNTQTRNLREKKLIYKIESLEILTLLLRRKFQ